VRGDPHTRTGSESLPGPASTIPKDLAACERQLPALVESERLTFGRSCELSTCSRERVFKSFP